MKCASVELVEQLVCGELSEHQAAETLAHAACCAACRHELRWAQTERGLFLRRAGRQGRDGFALTPPPLEAGAQRRSRWGLGAVAAAGLAFLAIGNSSTRKSNQAVAAMHAFARPLYSEDAVSRLATADCSSLPGGFGLRCSGLVAASFNLQ